MITLGSKAVLDGTEPVRIVGTSYMDANVEMPDGSIKKNIEWDRLSRRKIRRVS